MAAVMTAQREGRAFTREEVIVKLEEAWADSQGSPDLKGRRFPLAALYRVIGAVSLLELAERTGVTDRSISRWHTTGAIPERAADLVATRLGLHPALVWGESWWD